MVSGQRKLKLDRRIAVAKLLEARNGALVVSGLGSPTYDVHACGDRDDNYYLWGAMGGAALVGLGLAQAQPDKRIMVITGDGEMLMAMGGMATISVASPKNLDIFVIDNQHYGETGMQQSHTASGIDLALVAKSVGFSETDRVATYEDLDELCDRLQSTADGPRLFVLDVEAKYLPRSLPSRDAVYIKNRFRAQLGIVPN